MRTIYKWKLAPLESQKLQVGLHPKVVLVDCQDGDLCVWIEHDSAKDVRPTEVIVTGTGHACPDSAQFRHAGSAICGSYVWHVYVDTGRFT